MDERPAEAAREAIDELLMVLAKATNDLRTFHTAVSQARLKPLPPFPHAAVLVTKRVIDYLRQAEHGLHDDRTRIARTLKGFVTNVRSRHLHFHHDLRGGGGGAPIGRSATEAMTGEI
jgi:hypothetical protein